MRVNIAGQQNGISDCIQQQLTPIDISLRRQIGRNSSRTKTHGAFETINPTELGEFKRHTYRKSCAETSTEETEKIGHYGIFSVQTKGASQKKRQGRRNLLSHFSNSVTPKKRQQKKTTKIQVSLLTKKSNTSQSNLTKMSNDSKKNQKINDQNIKPFQMDNINIALDKQKRSLIDQPLVQKIKQPNFHNKHPLYQRIRSNGVYLSKMIAQRALQPKSNPFSFAKLTSQ